MAPTSILPPGEWWRKPFSVLQTNLREIDVDMDVDAVADYIQNHGATGWLIGVGGIQAQYPTELPVHACNPGLKARKSGDLIADAFQAAQSRGLRLLARMDFSKITAKLAAEHPDWCYSSPEGNLQEHSGDLVSVCPCGPYYQEHIFEILNEVTTRYALDGFFINWMTFNEEDYYKRYHGVCHCSNCAAQWFKYSGGLPLPKNPRDETYNQWLHFSRGVFDDLLTRINEFIKTKLPDACLMMSKTCDIIFHEANNAVGRELWPHSTSEIVSAWRSWRPEVPLFCNSVAFLDMPYRMASEEPAQFQQYIVQCLSRGGNPSTYIMGTPDKIPYACLDAAGELTRFHKKWSDYYTDLMPCAKTGLVRPERALTSAAHFDAALSEFRGLYSAMQELHIPFDVIGQEHLGPTHDNGGLKRYEVIILPDVGELGERDVEVLDDWVHAGGRLIATASSGIGSSSGATQLQSLPSERQRAVVRKRELLWSSYLAPPQTSADPHAYNGPIIPLYGTYHLFQWKKESEGKYKMLARAPFAPPEKAYGQVQVDQRGYGMATYGNGKGAVIPFTIGRAYRETGLSSLRDLFEEVLRNEGACKESLVFEIAEQVEVTVHTSGSRKVVHLVNMSGVRRQNFGPPLNITGGKIKFSKSGIKARALNADMELEVNDGEIILPDLGLFEVVVIEDL
jgi:hypothetical protein